MSWIDLVLLSVIQGIAEFLPISSSGHLVIAEALLGVTSGQADLNIALHFGTLLSILVYYRKRVIALLDADRRVIPLLIVGTIPAAVVGVIIKTQMEDLLHDTLLAGAMLPVTGAVMLWTARFSAQDKQYTDMTFSQALLIGVFQSMALLPGISRSGFTIFAALLVGQARNSAAAFSFLLAIPAILGATVLELVDVVTGDVSVGSLPQLGLGVLISFAIGVGALAVLARCVERGRLYLFAFWCIPLGLVVVVWQLFFTG